MYVYVYVYVYVYMCMCMYMHMYKYIYVTSRAPLSKFLKRLYKNHENHRAQKGAVPRSVFQ